jgi:hypothetical protein
MVTEETTIIKPWFFPYTHFICLFWLFYTNFFIIADFYSQLEKMLTVLIYKANLFIIVDFYFHNVFCFSKISKNREIKLKKKKTTRIFCVNFQFYLQTKI